MRRLLHLVERLAPSGVATQARLLAAADDQIETTVVSLAPFGPWRRNWRGVRVATLNKRFGFDPLARLAWRRLLRQAQPHAIVTADAESARFVSVAGHGGTLWGDLSHASTSNRRHPPRVAPQAFNATEVSPAKEATRARYRSHFGVNGSAPLIVAGLRMELSAPAKEIAWAADLVRVLKPGVRLVVCGDGPGRIAAERFAAAATEPGTVCFVGERADWPELMAAADVVWAPQAEHAEATSVIEARAAERPVVFASSEPPQEPPRGVRSVALNDRAGWARHTLELLDVAPPAADPQWLMQHRPTAVAARRREWLFGA